MYHRPSTFTLTLGSGLLCAAVLLCVLLATLPSASVARADEPQNWPTVELQIPLATIVPTDVPSGGAETPTPGGGQSSALPTATAIVPTEAPTETPIQVPPTLPPLATSTPVPTFTAVPTDTPTSIPTSTPIPTDTPTPTSTSTSTPSWLPPDAGCYVKPGKAVLTLDVPYIHQVNDISSADGNWACGPTSVAMVLAYYSKLQPWQAPDSPAPAGADSGAQFAPYVTNVYTNSGHIYSALAADPHGKMLAGLYGTISPTGLADWSRIKSALEWHGLTSQNVSVSFEGVKAALDRGHPVLIGNGLTAEGHILVAVGYTSNDQLLVNDPYGNRFASGYGSNQGQNVYYAWSCMRAHTALEVIGTYIPPATPTSTAEPTGTSTTVPTATATSTAAYTATPSQVTHESASLFVSTPTGPTGISDSINGPSLLHRAYALVAGATYNHSEAAISAGVGGAPSKVFAVILLLLSVLSLVTGFCWLIAAYRTRKRSLQPADKH